MQDVIRGERFIEIAHMTFAPPNGREDDYLNLKNTFDLQHIRDYDPCIVYTHTFYVNQLFDIIDGIHHRFVVITHNCDQNVNFAPPANVLKWYAQNVNIVHPRVESIPIGLQNKVWSRYGDKEAKMREKLKEPRKYKNLVYVNFSTATNPTKRLPALEAFRGKPWATIAKHTRNFERFDDYIDNIYNHKFVVCPEGNGIDTHRIWEALYMGSTPIVEFNINTNFYTELGIVRTCDWNLINKSLLDTLTSEFETPRPEMLTFEYWKNKILNTR